jgi:hypothetical protein
MAADVDITNALWMALTRRPLNMRFFTSVEQIRKSLEERRGSPLAEPTWWPRIRSLRDEAAVRKREEPEDEEDEPALAPADGGSSGD